MPKDLTVKIPPTDRVGRTHDLRVGAVTVTITVNRGSDGQVIEIFGKSDNGVQGHLDMACKLASLGLQNRLDVETLVRHLRGDRTEPCGFVGQPTSIYDAIGRVLVEECTSDERPERESA